MLKGICKIERALTNNRRGISGRVGKEMFETVLYVAIKREKVPGSG